MRKRRWSWVWLIPITSVAIGGWLLWKTLADRGPLINITFQTAEGLQAGQSQVKFKDIQMGTVESFDLTPDRRVVMHVRMTSKAKPLLTEGAKFWVVKPRVFAGDITGLNTVLSGTYMDMQPGQEGKPFQHEFTGLEHPPVNPDNPGRRFSLTAPRIGALSIGSPLFFHEVEVGKVLDWKLADMAEQVTLGVFVNAPYDEWVHDESIFWNTSGISLKFGSDGVQLDIESFKAAVLGGIAFDTPPKPNQAASAEGHQFTLYPRQSQAETATSRKKVVLATYLSGSVDGISDGAPVMLLGIPVGNVTSVELQFNTDTDQPRAHIGFSIDIDRATQIGDQPRLPFPQDWQRSVERGLRVHLKGGNILTGKKLLALEIDPDAPKEDMGHEGDVLVIPSTGGGGGIDDLTATADQLLAKIGRVPFEQIGQSLNGALDGVDKLVEGPEIKQALSRLNSTLAAAERIVRSIDAGAQPALKRLPTIAAELQATLSEAKDLIGSVSQGSAGSSRAGRDLDRLLVQVSEAAQSVRMVADLLSRHPEALIRGRTGRVAE